MWRGEGGEEEGDGEVVMGGGGRERGKGGRNESWRRGGE